MGAADKEIQLGHNTWPDAFNAPKHPLAVTISKCFYYYYYFMKAASGGHTYSLGNTYKRFKNIWKSNFTFSIIKIIVIKGMH